MTRPLDTATKNALSDSSISFATIVYLDIEGDVFRGWSGHGNLTFGINETGDPSLDGKVFAGTGNIIEISQISEGVGGSDNMTLTFPANDIDKTMLRQVIKNKNRWQFRRAIVWMVLLDPETSQIIGKPFRIKTGRMDQMPLVENNSSSSVKCKIEGQQSYGDTPLGTKYSEQININSNDTSQKWVHSLANETATLGKISAPGAVSSVSPSGGNSFVSEIVRRIV